MKLPLCWVVLVFLLASCNELAPPKPELPPDFFLLFPTRHGQPAWSRTGTIAYTDFGVLCNNPGWWLPDSSRVGVWVVRPDGTGAHRIVPRASQPSWDDSGTALMVVRQGIWRCRTDGTSLTRILGAASTFKPAWAPLGQAGVCAQVQNGSRLLLFSTHGGTWVGILGAGYTPSWSPSSAILYTRRNANDGNIYRTDVGGPTVQVTSGSADDRDPVQSPDGRWIAFSRNVGSGHHIWIARPDGFAARQVSSGIGCEPSWSPDSRQLVFSRCDDKNESGSGVLWIVSIETGEEWQLTSSSPPPCN